MTETRKPGWGFWTAAVLVSLALYVASVGPACWLIVKARQCEVGDRTAVIVCAVYAPMQVLYAATRGTRFAFVGDFLEKYGEWWEERATR